ncbi:MAG: S41 family peptidase [Planctomycetota bacterium]
MHLAAWGPRLLLPLLLLLPLPALAQGTELPDDQAPPTSRDPDEGHPAPAAEQAAGKGEQAAEKAGKVRLSVSSQPPGASVFVRWTSSGAERERFLGRTGERPLEVAVASEGDAELIVFKDGFVCRVEPLELKGGGAARLEVRLTHDVEVPFGLTLKGTKPYVRSSRESEELYVSVLAQVVRLHVKPADPFALVEASTKALVDVLDAVRRREQVLRRELPTQARKRYYGEELDLRAYPRLSFSRSVAASGKGTFSLAAGGRAVSGETDQDELDTYLHMLWKVYRFLKEEWDRERLLSHTMLSQIAIEGQLAALGDRHTSFLSPDDLEEMNTEVEGAFGGVGIVVALREGRLTVVAPMDGSPAKQAGLLPGDWITSIDGQQTNRVSMKRCVELMRGKVDSPVELGIRRGDQAPFTLTLLRAKVQIKHLSAHLLPNGIGYLRITSFMSDDLSDQVKEAIGHLRGQGARALVIDLRNNPGGLLPQAQRICDLFVEKGTIVYTKSRVGTGQKLLADPKHPKFRLPLAVLINGGSASASEILTGVLQEYHLATVVGVRSFGKGSVQRVIELDPYRCGLALTIATYHLPSGRTPHEKGIDPDIEVKLTEEQELSLLAQTNYTWDDAAVARDPQLQAALTALQKQLAQQAPKQQ